MIHTVTSPQGGLFAVSVDGFNTTDIIDTFAGKGSSLPLCYPVQFPPFTKPPPDLALKNNHSITLTHIGPSPKAPSGTTSSVAFDSFSLPEFQELATPTPTGGAMMRARATSSSISLIVGFALPVILCL